MPKLSCVDCKHAAWQRTPSGRIQNAAGRCFAPLPDLKPLIPYCAEEPRMSKRAIWPHDKHDCPLWEKSQ